MSYIGIYSVNHEPNALCSFVCCATLLYRYKNKLFYRRTAKDPVLQDEHEDPREICIIATEDRHVPRHQSDCD